MTPELENILKTYKSKPNKELNKIVVNLFKDFNAIKESILILNANLGEIEKVYNAVYAELQSRLKFETPKQ
jgi:hypothetical protein